jgi:hypothetical protein
MTMPPEAVGLWQLSIRRIGWISDYDATHPSKGTWQVYDATPIVGPITPPTNPGDPFIITGSSFGNTQGTINVCAWPNWPSPYSSSTCASTPPWTVGSISLWGATIRAILIPPLGASGHYCVQVTRLGLNGVAFVPAPNAASNATSNCGGDIVAPAPTVRIMTQNGNNVSDATQTVIIGQQVVLNASYSPYSPAGLTQNWTIGGTYVGGFTGSTFDGQTCPATVANPTPTAGRTCSPDTTKSALTYYFTEAGSNVQVTYSATDSDGINYTAKTFFNIVKPTADTSFSIDAGAIQATAGGSDAIAADTALGYMAIHYGMGTGAIPAGVRFLANYLLPPGGYAGTAQWVQVTTASTVVRTPVDGTARTKDCSNRYDQGNPPTYPYDSNQNGTSDSPNNELLVGYNDYNLNQTYTMMLMFRPSLPNSIFVPLATASWAWSAHVISPDGGHNWAFVSKTPASPVVRYANQFLTWTDNTATCIYK